jgi:hypothetical protein
LFEIEIGTAEWDRPLPPLPKLSPYLYPHNFVTTRWDIKKPNQDEKGRRRTNWQVGTEIVHGLRPGVTNLLGIHYLKSLQLKKK